MWLVTVVRVRDMGRVSDMVGAESEHWRPGESAREAVGVGVHMVGVYSVAPGWKGGRVQMQGDREQAQSQGGPQSGHKGEPNEE